MVFAGLRCRALADAIQMDTCSAPQAGAAGQTDSGHHMTAKGICLVFADSRHNESSLTWL
jgi:hypothetical protein